MIYHKSFVVNHFNSTTFTELVLKVLPNQITTDQNRFDIFGSQNTIDYLQFKNYEVNLIPKKSQSTKLIGRVFIELSNY